MLPLWRKRYMVAIGTAQIAVRAGAGAPQVLAYQARAGEPPWQAALDALRVRLQSANADGNPPMAGARLHCIVSDALVHYALLPWPFDLHRQRERDTLVRIHFDTLFGVPAAGWVVQADFSRYGSPVMACALDGAFMQQLQALLAAFDVRLDALQPYFMCAWNRWRTRIGSDALFVVQDADQCVLACRKDGHWHSIRSLRYAGADDCRALLDRERLLQGLASDVPLWVHAPGAGELHAGHDGAQFLASPSALPLHDAALGMLLCGAA